MNATCLSLTRTIVGAPIWPLGVEMFCHVLNAPRALVTVSAASWSLSTHVMGAQATIRPVRAQTWAARDIVVLGR